MCLRDVGDDLVALRTPGESERGRDEHSAKHNERADAVVPSHLSLSYSSGRR